MHEAKNKRPAPDIDRLARQNDRLDEALLETFPASDPVSINFDGPAENTAHNAKVLEIDPVNERDPGRD